MRCARGTTEDGNVGSDRSVSDVARGGRKAAAAAAAANGDGIIELRFALAEVDAAWGKMPAATSAETGDANEGAGLSMSRARSSGASGNERAALVAAAAAASWAFDW